MPIRLQLDWCFEGSAPFFLCPAARGYFTDAKLDVSADAGSGSGAAAFRAMVRAASHMYFHPH